LQSLTFEFNIADSLDEGLGRACQGRIFTGAHSNFLDALPAATNDSYGYQRELNPCSLCASLPSQFTYDLKFKTGMCGVGLLQIA